MSLALFVACGLVAGATILAIVLVAVLDWAAAPFAERLALCAIAAGLVWAAPSRFAAGGVGLGDLVLLAGILALVLITYGRRLALHVDQADGRRDGLFGPLRLSPFERPPWPPGSNVVDVRIRSERPRRR